MPKTKKAKEQAELATPIDTKPKSPIDYSFSYRFERDDDGRLTGLIYLIVTAKCEGVPLFNFEKAIIDSTILPKLKEDLDPVAERTLEVFRISSDMLLYSNIDCQFSLSIDKEIINKCKEIIKTAHFQMKDELDSLANQNSVSLAKTMRKI